MASIPPQPQPLGARKSFGFGDGLGLGTPGHVAAATRCGFAPVFAQVAIRDLERLRRPAAAVVVETQAALVRAGHRGAWGADISGIKTEGDVDRALSAGFSRFTLDPSGFIEPRGDHLDVTALARALGEIINEGILPAGWAEVFGEHRFEVAPDFVLHFAREDLQRAAVKLARAVHHTSRLIRRIVHAAGPDACEVEVALTGANAPTTPLEHLFIALELKRRGTPPAAFAPRLATRLEPGVDFQTDAADFRHELAWHAAIARRDGSCKISVHGVANKFSLLPAIGRIGGDLLHVKTNGLDYLEALRVVCRAAPEFFRVIARQARKSFEAEGPPAGVSTTVDELGPLFESAGKESLENVLLGTPAGRQMLLSTSMSILTSSETFQGGSLRDGILGFVGEEASLYCELLEGVYARHLALLEQRETTDKEPVA